MVMSKGAVLDLAHTYFQDARASYERARLLDYWGKGRQSESADGKLFVPGQGQGPTAEYKQLGDISYTPWLALIVTALVQTMYVGGIRLGEDVTDEVLDVERVWKRNEWDSKQVSLYRDQFTHGHAYGTSLPGRDQLSGALMPILRGVSARRMLAFWADPQDEYPMFTLEGEQVFGPEGNWGYDVQLMDEEAVHYVYCKGDGESRSDWFYKSYDEHNTGVCPVACYVNMVDLDGNITSEIEPLIPIARRIDQTEFDRLIVQRFGAWKVRYITGLVKPENMSEADHAAGLLKLKISDLLAIEGKDSKVGTLDETQLDGFIKARDADIRDLSAVSQTPPHHMLGLASNMQPESLAAVNANLVNKSFERKIGTGVSHRRLLRCSAKQMGNMREAQAYDMQINWKDTETRSLAQAADALGKLATQLQLPVEMLWRRIPDWTEFDTREAKSLVEGGAFDKLLDGLASQGVDLGDG